MLFLIQAIRGLFLWRGSLLPLGCEKQLQQDCLVF